MSSARVTRFDRRYLPDFVALNREWIERHFAVEPMDLEQLESPFPSILEPGGEIFFVLEPGGPDDPDGAPARAVGTAAMVPHGPGRYELAKMAVAPEARGRGYGDLLMETAVAWARERGAERVTILSNTVLEPAIALYLKHGFKTVRLGPHPDYRRCNIEMELRLAAPGAKG